jgi:hypothetical protein
MRMILLATVLLCGCLTQQSITEKYVCADGSISGTAGACAGHTLDCPKCVCTAATTAHQPVQAVLTQPATTASVVDDTCVAIGCPAGSKFVSSKTSDKYHACTCQFAAKLSAKSRVCYVSAQEAQAAGKQPCGICIGKI